MASIRVKHTLHVILFTIHFFVFLQLVGFMDVLSNTVDGVSHYGLFTASILYILKLFTLLGTPVTILNAIGILLFDMFPRTDRVTRRSAPLLDPFISFRVVTRGLFPDLVRDNVERNLRTCEKFGMDKFVIEVVTDKEIGSMPRSAKVREIVVPDEYRTPAGTKFKARALQYALEPYVDILNDDDWIVHLDEETIVTNSSLIGILNFVHENKHQIGQGLITYGKEEVISWMSTLADSIRVAADMGSMRLSLKAFHKPLYSFKGSFIVCQSRAERVISFDNGAQGSIAEDAYFACKAVNLGYSFDWVEGEMLEKSPFSFLDFIKQRKRWVQGLYLLVHDERLKLNFTKCGFTYSFYMWILFPAQLIVSLFMMYHPISFSILDELLSRLNGIIFIYMFGLGAVKSLNLSRRRPIQSIVCFLGVFVSIPYLMVSETIAIVWGLTSRKSEFFIVKKNEMPTQIV